MTYSFECKDCGKDFEIEKGINEDIDIKCIECNSRNIKRIFKPIGNVWNCSGAYGKGK